MNYLKILALFGISIGTGFACHYAPDKSIIMVTLGLASLGSIVLAIVMSIITLLNIDVNNN